MEKKILVIEDDPATLRLIDYTLRHEGYRILTATDGLEGVRRVQELKPDLIVLDVMLPGIDGFEVCHHLRSDSDTAAIPILMLSAKAQDIDRSTGLKVGASDYLAKPADPAEIARRVKALLKQPAPAAPDGKKVHG